MGKKEEKKMKLIAITNQKGGVGKTTTSTSIAKGLADKGHKVLIIDADQQANATDIVANIGNNIEEEFLDKLLQNTEDQAFKDMNEDEKMHQFMVSLNGCLYKDYQIKYTLTDVFKDDGQHIKDYIMKTDVDNLDIIPSSLDLGRTKIELILQQMTGGTINKLKQALEPIKDEYDYVIVDCPPDQNLIIASVIYASDLVLIPLKSDKGSLKGFLHTYKYMLDIEKKNNLHLNFKFLFSIFDNNKVNKKLYQVFKAYAGEYILNSYVRYRGKPASQASMNNQYLIDSKLNVGYDSKKLVDEIERNIEWNL